MSRRVAAAPITWGVCEVPRWGHQMRPERVLAEMSALGFTATELGPEGFLPSEPRRLRRLLSDQDLELVAGFVPAVLHRRRQWPAQRAEVIRQVSILAQGGASMLVLAASTGEAGYQESADLTDEEWAHLVVAVSEVERLADEQGLTVSLHPHHGTVVETPEDVERLMSMSTCDLCLDTGHVMVGGGNPVALTRNFAERISHVHLKDVDADVAARVHRGEFGYHEAVRAGLYRILGTGDADIPSILGTLDQAGYAGWYVLEQDTVLTGEPPEGGGPMSAAAASFEFLTESVPAARAGGA